MQINYNLTEEDYVNFNVFHIKNSKLAISNLRRRRFLAPLLFIIIAYVFSDVTKLPFIPVLAVTIILGVLWVIFYPKMFYGRITRKSQKAVDSGKIKPLLGDHEMKITKDGIVDSTNYGKTTAKWSDVTNFAENPAYFYLYISSVSALILPKRDLGEIENVDQLRNYFRAKINKYQ